MSSVLMVRAGARASVIETFVLQLRQLTLDRQGQTLETEAARVLLPAAVRQRELRRIRRERDQSQRQLEALRRPCYCKRCRARRRWPDYYAPSHLSFECYLEQQPIDPGLEEELARLRGASGSIIREVPSKFRGKNRQILG